LTITILVVNSALRRFWEKKSSMPIEKLRLMVLASLMAALTAVGAYIYIPIGPVPVVLTNLFVFLAGLLLGSRWGLASVGIYLMLGAMGIPVFAGGKGGLVHFLGPTGGYLVGFAVAAWMMGFISERLRGSIVHDVLSVSVGALAIYGVGIPWLKWMTGMSWSKSVWVGMVPFVVGDVLKASGAVVLARAIRPVLKRSERGLQS
jgi:biotin transport system substrate-specific component